MSNNTAEPNYTAGNFAHRPNVDGTFDSICRVCFRIIVRSEKQEGLASYESTHECLTSAIEFKDREIRLLELRSFA
jgi:hypothetical protein